ncbi:recombinase family protein [Sphingobium sp. AN641]|uniref:recombinase family protein n=1 Tax=Sphingobium sp. AN641 TaxID=3133443 RepID=UPI0030C315AE
MARRRASPEPAQAGRTRCAVYTRKSTDEGLDQAFNSLDAQYEACTAYIASQRHEGWTLARERYDDGGFSGGSMERPGLQRLLDDVAAGRVQVIILYKIDRLTRSLSDFARIVDVLDKAGASFVSITQSFNTTTSMGRLTLNMLLSFAQFEREVTAERIRDKFAASRAKGMWMGGSVPLGYKVQDRKLVVDEADAKTVRYLFACYADLGSSKAVLAKLREQQITTKAQPLSDGRIRGGGSFTPGGLFYLLKNRTYIGEVVHKGAVYPGEHPAIIDADLWAQVQERIALNATQRVSRANATNPSLLAGRIIDGLGRPMTPSHATKGGRRYRYYITHESSITDAEPVWRISAPDAEAAVRESLKHHLGDRSGICRLIDAAGGDAQCLGRALDRAADAIRTLTDRPRERALVESLVTQVKLLSDHIEISIDPHAAAGHLGLPPLTGAVEPLIERIAIARVRIGKQVRLVLGDAPSRPDATLVELLTEAHAARERVMAAPGQTIQDIAAATGQCRKRFAKLVRLSWLSPSLAKAVLDGAQPPHLDARALLAVKLPLDWPSQRRVLGFA